jgi:hypothetical protein
MTYRSIFDVKAFDAPFSAVFSFALDLALGETLSTASTTAAAFSGADASPNAIVSGSAAISGGEVTQLIVDGVIGVVYLLICTATTSEGQTLTRSGYLAIARASV